MNKLVSLITFITLFSIPLLSHTQVPENICITKEEQRLAVLINDYRAKSGLPAITISKSLSYVAKLHVRDLFHNKPDTSYCSISSWSDKGSWSPCCHSRQTPQPACILNKPREIVKYPGEAHELAYWENNEPFPDTILKFWISINSADALLLNRDTWSKTTWKAMGVGMYKGYVSVWLGEFAIEDDEVVVCAGNDVVIPITRTEASDGIFRSPVDRYFLIFGSFNSAEDAKKEALKYKEEGFYQAKIIEKDNTFKVSLSDHATMDEAREAKSRIPKEYQQAWILKF